MLQVALLGLALAISAAAADEPIAGAVPPAAIPRDTTYALDISQGMPVIEEIELGGQSMKAVIDTGAPEIALPASIAAQMQLLNLTQQQVLDFAGSGADYPEGFFMSPRIGGQLPAYQSAAIFPDAQLQGHAILPLSAFEGKLLMFLCSEGRFVVGDAAPAWNPAPDSGTGPSQLSFVPYWENIAGLFVGITAGGKYYFAQLDTGSSLCTATPAFIAANPQLFAATGRSGSFGGVHGRTGAPEQVYRITGELRLLSIDGKGDVALPAEVSAVPVVRPDGRPLDPAELGNDTTPYLGISGPAPWPVVMTIGMDLLGQYDFAFDTSQHLLMLMQPQTKP
jgi:hypothetical protein